MIPFTARSRTDHRGAAAVLALALAIAVLAPPAGAQAPAPKRGGTMKLTYLEPVTLNSLIVSGTTAGIYGAQIFAGLLELDDQFNARPYLAERWEVSPDGLTYTFHLVAGATFHDGAPITSEDVKFSAEKAKEVHPFGLAVFRYLEAVDTPSPQTAVFRLSKPYPAMLRTLVPLLVPILPKHVYADGDIRKNPANRKPVGSGPFKFVEWQQGRHLILERNENFFRKGRPYLDRLVYEFIPDPATRVAGLETGDLHLVPFSYVPFVEARRLEKTPAIGLTTVGAKGYGSINLIQLNLRNQYLKELKVRQAIAHALDREFIAKELLQGFGRPATGPLVSANPFYSAQVPRYEYSLDKANRLLDEAGFKRGADAMRFKLQHELSAALPDITTDFLSNYPDPVIGIDRTFLSSNIKKGVAYSNVMGYSNAEVDRLLASAQTEQNADRRKRLYARVQEILVSELPIIWINELQFATLYNKDYQGLPQGVLGVLDPFDTIYWTRAK